MNAHILLRLGTQREIRFARKEKLRDESPPVNPPSESLAKCPNLFIGLCYQSSGELAPRWKSLAGAHHVPL